MDFRIELLGKENLVRGFEGLVRYAGNLRPIFTEIHKDFLKMEKENFDKVGFPEKFKALSRVYRRRKSKKAPGQPIMQLSGDLRGSLTGERSGHIFEFINDIKVRMGSSVKYAHRHQVGHKMPRRRIIQLTPERKKSWSYFIHRFLVKGIKEQLSG